MTQQPEALRLADAMQELDGLFSRTGACGEAAAELRRLHEVNAELLNALKRIVDEPNNTMSDGKALKEIIRIGRAAIAKATGEQT